MPSTDTTGRSARVLARRVAGPVVLVGAIVAAVAVGTAGPGVSALPRSGVPVPTSSQGPKTATPFPSSQIPSAPSETGGATPGIDSPGVSMTVFPRPNGDLDVVQSVILAAPVTQIRLSPPDLSMAGAAFAARTTSFADMSVAADGQTVIPTNSAGLADGLVVLPSPASAFVLRYSLQNAVVRSRPSVKGRALAALRPISFGDGSERVMINIPSRSVLSVVCPDLGSSDITNCAGPTVGGYGLTDALPVASALLVVQLDLDRAS